MGSSFSQLTQSTDPSALVTFSSHSMSFKALVEIDYWPVDMISDDSAIYWKAYIHYAGAYTVVPMLVTVSMDLAQDENVVEDGGEHLQAAATLGVGLGELFHRHDGVPP